MANNENKSTLMHDAIMLFVITLIAGVLLGGVYTCLLYTSPSPRDRG